MRFRVVDAPGLRKPLLMAYSFALALSLGDLGAVALFGGNSLVTLPWLIYARLGSYRTTDAAALTLILTVICMALAVLGTPGQGKRGKAE
jgi:thiamine transport system permease protein